MTAALAGRCDVPDTLAEQIELASSLAASDIIPHHLYRKPANVLAIMYAARSIDVALWPALHHIQVFEGRAAMAAEMMRGLILRAGHTFRIETESATEATYIGVRKDDPDAREHHATFTQADAETAGLWGTGTWAKYPKAMLKARAASILAREVFADVILGMDYSAEELSDIDAPADVRPQQPPPTPADAPAEVLDTETIAAALDDIVSEHEVPAA